MPSYINYGSWAIAILGLAVFYYIKSRNESKIPEDYEGLICGRCRKPCEEIELSSFVGLHIRVLKLFRGMPFEELEQQYCSSCKKRLQQVGYLLLASVAAIIFMFLLLFVAKVL